MEELTKLSEYIKSDAQQNIVEQKKNPLPGLLVMVCGVGLLAVSLKLSKQDSAQMLLLTAGILMLMVGLFMVVRVFVAGCGFVYQPTGAKMKRYCRYIHSGDRQMCADILQSGKLEGLKRVKKEVSTGSRMVGYISADGRYAVAQQEEYIPHDFVPKTGVLEVAPEEVPHLLAFMKE